MTAGDEQTREAISTRPSARPAALILASAGVILITLLAAGCGGSTSSSSSAGGGTGSGSRSANELAFSRCMRKNGVPNFPDPGSNGRIKIAAEKAGIDVNSSRSRKALEACRNLLPNGGKPSAQEQAKERQTQLEFSACMRSHGVRKFPDPKLTPDGGSTMTIGPQVGVDPNSPQFRAANDACQKLVAGGPIAPGKVGPTAKP